jgi:hypothetical protein
MSFYAYLFSDSSCSYFSENNPARFTNLVHHRLKSIAAEYEVALCQISYYNGFEVLNSDSDRIITVFTGKGLPRTLIIPSRPYKDLNELITTIMTEISSVTRNINIIMLTTDTILIRVAQGSLQLSGLLAKLLGFDILNKFSPGDHSSRKIISTDLSPKRIYVTTDLISAQIVGEKMLQVLRVFDNEVHHGVCDSVNLEPYYVPVTK